MSTFKPPADTFFAKVLKNATVLFFIVVLGLFAGTFFFYKSTKSKEDALQGESRRSSLSQRHYIRDDGRKIEVAGTLKPGMADGEPDTQTAEIISNAGKGLKDQSTDEIRANLESQLFKKEGGTKEQPSAAGQSNQFELHVYFAEVSQKGLDMLIQEARANGQMSNTDFAQGVLNMPMAKVLSYREEFSVYSEQTKHLEKNKSSDWFQGLKSAGPDSDIGLLHTAHVKESPNGRIQLDVKITKRYQGNPNEGSAKGFQSSDYVGSGEIEKDQTYFVSEILSKYPMSLQQEYLTAISPFEIYKSQNFLSGKSFSVFFYTIENK